MKQIKQNHHYKLKNGVRIPAVGFGTWQTPDGCTAVSAVKAALCGGYSHIDTAAVYGNEESVGRGIRESQADRSDCSSPASYGTPNGAMTKRSPRLRRLYRISTPTTWICT